MLRDSQERNHTRSEYRLLTHDLLRVNAMCDVWTVSHDNHMKLNSMATILCIIMMFFIQNFMYKKWQKVENETNI